MKKIKTSIESLLPLIEESFQNNQEVSIPVKGTSMSPTFKDNQTKVTLVHYQNKLVKNNVYLYKYENRVLLHRYLKTKNETHIFRGDNCINYEYVDEDNIIGFVTKVDNIDFKTTVKTKYILFIKNVKAKIKKRLRGSLWILQPKN